jgi:hypothetical protein
MVIRALILLAATVAFGVAPFVTEPFRGYSANLFPVAIQRPAIQPAGFSFSIWALIYLGLIVHAVFGLMRRSDDPDWDRVRLMLAGSVGIGAFWLAIAAVFPITATNGIYVMLLLALAAFLRANPLRDRWLLTTPVAIYAGWLTAAANVSLGVVIAGYGLLTNTQSAIAMLALTLVITVTLQLRRPHAPEYGLTVIWALFGIVWVNRVTNTTVAVIAAAGIAVVAITILFAWRRSRRQPGQILPR